MISETVPTRKARPHTADSRRFSSWKRAVFQTRSGACSRA